MYLFKVLDYMLISYLENIRLFSDFIARQYLVIYSNFIWLGKYWLILCFVIVFLANNIGLYSDFMAKNIVLYSGFIAR